MRETGVFEIGEPIAESNRALLRAARGRAAHEKTETQEMPAQSAERALLRAARFGVEPTAILSEPVLPPQPEPRVSPKTAPESSPELPEIRRVVFGVESLAHENHPERNEDAYFVSDDGLSIGIFDGMGGYNGGEIASNLVRDVVDSKLAELDRDASVEVARQTIVEATKEAQAALVARARSERSVDLSAMGTTASIVRLCPQSDGTYAAVIGHVGDSRIYLVDRASGSVEQLTTDHTVSAGWPRGEGHKNALGYSMQEVEQAYYDHVNLNDIDDENLRSSVSMYRKSGSTLTQALSVSIPWEEPDEVPPVSVVAGQWLLLTSDGIHDNLSPMRIREIVQTQGQPAEVARQLAQEAQARSQHGLQISRGEALGEPGSSKPDDMTALIFAIPRSESAVASAPEEAVPEEVKHSPKTELEYVFEEWAKSDHGNPGIFESHIGVHFMNYNEKHGTSYEHPKHAEFVEFEKALARAYSKKRVQDYDWEEDPGGSLTELREIRDWYRGLTDDERYRTPEQEQQLLRDEYREATDFIERINQALTRTDLTLAQKAQLRTQIATTELRRVEIAEDAELLGMTEEQLLKSEETNG